MKINKSVFKQLIFSFITIFSLLFLLTFSSCSQNVPEITFTNYSVVFSFDDDESKPDARLSIFMQNMSDVRRCERIKICATEKNYIWETKNIKKICAGDYSWAGNVNLVVPEGELFPQGRYEITYTNADEEECKTSFNLYYDQNIYSFIASDVLEKLDGRGNLNLAIYDDNKILIYFGERTEDLMTKGDIFNTYPNAVYFNDVWLSYDKSVICILPENKL